VSVGDAGARRRRELHEFLRHGELILDAGMGTALLARGLRGRAPGWNLERPDEVLAVHRGHVAAGAQLVLTNTFVGASAAEASAALRLARESGARFVGASLYAGLPDLAEQIGRLSEADCVWLETATSSGMALAAVRSAVPMTPLPVVITCAMRAAPLDELRAIGAGAAGYNCSPWPADAAGADVVKLDAAALDAAAWARAVPRARLRGGCCGTTAAHLAALGGMKP
jgi:methionine synthase I (cobalamin-dependent)